MIPRTKIPRTSFTNNIVNAVEFSVIDLFTDDAILHKCINTANNLILLQRDQHALEE